jgi:hypothetical protein
METASKPRIRRVALLVISMLAPLLLYGLIAGPSSLELVPRSQYFDKVVGSNRLVISLITFPTCPRCDQLDQKIALIAHKYPNVYFVRVNGPEYGFPNQQEPSLAVVVPGTENTPAYYQRTLLVTDSELGPFLAKRVKVGLEEFALVNQMNALEAQIETAATQWRERVDFVNGVARVDPTIAALTAQFEQKEADARASTQETTVALNHVQVVLQSAIDYYSRRIAEEESLGHLDTSKHLDAKITSIETKLGPVIDRLAAEREHQLEQPRAEIASLQGQIKEKAEPFNAAAKRLLVEAAEALHDRNALYAQLKQRLEGMIKGDTPA